MIKNNMNNDNITTLIVFKQVYYNGWLYLKMLKHKKG